MFINSFVPHLPFFTLLMAGFWIWFSSRAQAWRGRGYKQEGMVAKILHWSSACVTSLICLSFSCRSAPASATDEVDPDMNDPINHQSYWWFSNSFPFISPCWSLSSSLFSNIFKHPHHSTSVGRYQEVNSEATRCQYPGAAGWTGSRSWREKLWEMESMEIKRLQISVTNDGYRCGSVQDLNWPSDFDLHILDCELAALLILSRLRIITPRKTQT